MSDGTGKTSERTILMVDDVEYTRQLLRNSIMADANNRSKTVSQPRYKFVTASTGQDTFAKIEQFQPELIFLDIELPDLNGIEVLKRIKEIDPKAYVIMVSGESTIENVKESLKNGASGFIVKPFSAVKISEALRSFEKKRRK